MHFFRRALDARLNYKELRPGDYQYTNYHPKYLISTSSLFPSNLTQDDFKIYAPYAERDYVNALIGRSYPNVTCVNVKFSYITQLKKSRHLIERTPMQRLLDFFYFNCASHNASNLITDRMDEKTVPLIVSTSIVEEFYKCVNCNRPAPAFYRYVIKHISEYNNNGIPLSIIADTLLYIRSLPASDKVVMDTCVCGVVNCLDQPRNARAVASMGVGPIKLDSYGTFEKDTDFYIMYPTPSYMQYKSMFAYYGNRHQNVVDSAVASRVCLGRPTQKVDPITVYKAFHDFYADLIPLIEDATYLTFDQLLNVHPRGKLYEGHYQDDLQALDQKCQGFVKTEPYPFKDNGEGGTSAPPRGIIVPGKESTAYGLKFTHLIEHYLKRSPHFSKAKNFEEVASDLKRIWDSIPGAPCVIGCDFTQFENGISAIVLVASMALYNYLTGMPDDYIKAWLNKTIYFGKSWLIREIAKRISGEYQTSLGNMLIVGAIQHYIASQVSYDVDWYSAGDDCMFFVDQEHVDDLKIHIMDVVTSFGMLIKLEDVYTEFDTIHFCQQYPVLTQRGWVMMNDLTRVLDKLGTQPKVLTHSKLCENRLGCLGDYINYLYGSLPFLRDLISKLRSYKPYNHHYFTKAFHTSSNWNLYNLAIDTNFFNDTPYEILDPERVLSVMNFPKSLQDFYAKFFKTWDPYDYINHRIYAEHVVEDGKIIFQIGDYALYNITPKFHDTDLDHPIIVQEDPSLNQISDSVFAMMLNMFN